MGEPLAGLAPIETAQEATQEALQVIKEIPKNLVLGAELVCPCGSSHSYLNLETEEIEIGNLPQATVKDCRPKDNIQPFGTCWQGFFSIPHSCEKMMDLAEEWENPEPQTMLLNGEEVITTKSTLVCYASGREIYAVSSGQGGDNRFAKQQKLYLDVEKDYPGLLARLTDPHGSLYLEGGKYREAIGFLKDYLDERGGEVFLPGIYDMKEPEDVLVVAILDRLLTDCDASSYERLISGLENTGAQTGMYDKQGWDVYTLNQKMLYMLSIDSQATAEKMETSSFARWVEGHKKFMGILGDVVTEVAYGAVLYRCQTAKAVSKPKGEGGTAVRGTLAGKLDGLTAAEKTMVNDLLNAGNDVEIIPRSNISGQKTPDFLVNGVKTELKTLTGTSLNTPVTRIQDGFKQGAEAVIIDGRNTGLTIDNANTVIERALGKYGGELPGTVEIWTIEGIIRR